MNAIAQPRFEAIPRPRILVIDDDVVTRKAIARILHRYGYDVSEATDGESGLQLFAEQHFELVLLDVMMPGMNGYQTCEHLRKHANSETLPIMMLTGLDDISAVDQAFDAGATDFITKPINWSLLAQRIRYALRSRYNALNLKASEKQLANAQRIARLGYWHMDGTTDAITLSEQTRQMLRLPHTETHYTLNTLLNLVHKDDLDKVSQTLAQAVSNGQPYQLEHRMTLIDGEEIIVQQQGETVTDETTGLTRLLGTVQDITDRRRAEAEIEYRTYYDPLSGLPNRKTFENRCHHLLSDHDNDESLSAIFFLSLDRIKDINDSLGHSAVDTLLKAVAERLNELSSGGHFIARFSDEAFSLIISQLKNIDECDDIAKYILQHIARPFIIDEHEIYITASIGISLHPLEGDNVDELLKGADTAMSQSRLKGGNTFSYHTAEMNNSAQNRLRLETKLRHAIDNEEFRVYYQPQLDARNMQVIGMEALVRWEDPERGLMSPAEFIPLAEETGLITPIGTWVLQTACRDVKRWQAAGLGTLRVGVNLSAQQFRQENLIDIIRDTLTETGLKPSALEVEVTESMAMYNFEDSMRTLEHIKALGVHISMDDFGTGYSSLSYLQQMPLNTLKVDQAFIRPLRDEDIDADGNPISKHGAIASAVIAMAHSLGLNVIAEGVETPAQERFIRRQGADQLQGFLYSKPLPCDEFEALLKHIPDRETNT